MNLDDYGRLWRGSGTEEVADPQAVLAAGRRLKRRLWWRDLRELAAAALVAVAFTWILVDADNWVTRAGALITLGGAVLIAVRLVGVRLRQRRSTPDQSLVAELKAEASEVRDQMALLRSVLWWYILPILAGVSLVFAGGAGSGWATLGFVALMLAFGAGLWWLNQRAVSDELEPHHRHLLALIDRLEQSPE